MNIQFPFHTAVNILCNMVIVGALAALGLVLSLSRLEISSGEKRKWQVLIIGSFIVWFSVRVMLGHSRIIAPAQLIVLSSGAFYSTVALTITFSAIFRQAALAIPQETVIGIQTVRVGGFVFLALLDMRLLPPQFALPAGYGDIIVGVTAPFVVYALYRNKPFARGLAIAWNLAGLLDFIIALITGFTFIGPYVRQLARTGHSIAYLDYVLMIPGFAVPILAMLHVASLKNLLSGAVEKRIRFQS